MMDTILKRQYKLIDINVTTAITPRSVPFRRRYNWSQFHLKKYASDIDGIADITRTPENYEQFVYLVWKVSNMKIIWGCPTNYVCGLNYQTKLIFEDYQRRWCEV